MFNTKIWHLIFYLTATMLVFVLGNRRYASEADCRQPSKERHCMIESAAKDKWPHSERFRFNWDEQECILIRWSDACGTSNDPNHFTSKEECHRVCGGYA